MIENQVFSEIYKKDFKRICWLLAKGLGIGRYNEAEDAVQEAFTLAFENWSKTGLPENPSAWIYKVAKNLVLQRIRSNKEVGLEDIEERKLSTSFPNYNESDASKLDAQIEVAFACCNPALPIESQIALVLKTLFGFSVQEVADALLVNYDTVEKRLQRARKLAREIEIKPELPVDFEDRLPALLHVIYLIFNEGYYSKGTQQTRFLF
ncbi:MAG: sigma-70 family RNA polymerase sigma factor, partial [Flexibacteraceae bacterium]